MFVAHSGDTDEEFWEFLRSICMKSRCMYVWVDFICIPRFADNEKYYDEIPNIVRKCNEFVVFAHDIHELRNDKRCIEQILCSEKKKIKIWLPNNEYKFISRTSLHTHSERIQR